jgi:hypothetical protein
MKCGAEKHHDALVPPLVCDLEAGHEGTHATVGIFGPIARWPVAWTEADERTRRGRLEWSKPHVRKEYTTLAKWKAAQE